MSNSNSSLHIQFWKYILYKVWYETIRQVSTGFSLGFFQRALCPLGALMWLLGLSQNHLFALWFHLKTIELLKLKTVLAPNIKLREHWTELKCFGQWHTGNKCLELPINTFKMMGVVLRYYLCPLACKFWWEHWVSTTFIMPHDITLYVFH